MSKIFYYELKRTIFSGAFLGMFIINAVCSWYILTTDIISGIGYTAPFSVWSYCAYMGKMMPVIMTAVLLLLATYYGKKQKQVEVLICAASASPVKLMLVRTAVLGVCFAVFCMLAAAMAMIFYFCLFGVHSFGAFFIPSLFILLPCFFLPVGLGLWLGKFHQGLIYLLTGIVLAVVLCNVPHVFDFTCADYLSVLPVTLPVNGDGEPDFVMSSSFVMVRLFYLGTGIVCLWFGTIRANHKAKNA